MCILWLNLQLVTECHLSKTGVYVSIFGYPDIVCRLSLTSTCLLDANCTDSLEPTPWRSLSDDHHPNYPSRTSRCLSVSSQLVPNPPTPRTPRATIATLWFFTFAAVSNSFVAVQLSHQNRAFECPSGCTLFAGNSNPPLGQAAGLLF